jgi:hypothetical protein
MPTRGPQAEDQRDFGQQALATTAVTLMSNLNERDLDQIAGRGQELEGWIPGMAA